MSAKLGTPENPEIIDPREPRRPPQPPPSTGGRFSTVLRLLLTMISVSVPALGLDMICLALVRMGLQPDGLLAWLPLIFLAPIAAVLTLVAIVLNLLLFVGLAFTLSGRSVNLPGQGIPFLRFVRMRR